uniref:Occludin_ELL domain-containing protein n=1 Tax=Echinostoma caproni TaxID=27848 RepID=A0A183AQ56_9TREM
LKPTSSTNHSVIHVSGRGESNPHISRERAQPASSSNREDPRQIRIERPSEYMCLSVLREDRAHFSKRANDQSLPSKEREEYQFRLGEAEKRYERLKKRLYSGPNRAREMRAYIQELRVLENEWYNKYSSAKLKGDSKKAEYYAERLDLLRNELRQNADPRPSNS